VSDERPSKVLAKPADQAKISGEGEEAMNEFTQ
jgi:hypothetical protein